MKSWKRITLVIFVLIGGTIAFSYWSINQFNQVINQFNQAFDDLNAAYLANTSSGYSSFKQSAGLASTSPKISGELATSTTDETIPVITSTTTTATTTPVTTTSTEVVLSFTFPQKGDEVYIGCTYPISWQSSTIISSLEIALIDAGTKESTGPIASGLAKENMIETDSQNLNWKVGVVWPGEYYIKVSNINGVDLENYSKVFTISKMPRGISVDEREKICKESDGSF